MVSHTPVETIGLLAARKSRSVDAVRHFVMAPVKGFIEVPRVAVVRATGATVREKPDISSKAVVALPAGAEIEVRRLFWNGPMRWAFADPGPASGYVANNKIDLHYRRFAATGSVSPGQNYRPTPVQPSE